MQVDMSIRSVDLKSKLDRFFNLATGKIRKIDKTWDPDHGTPVFTVDGKYTTRGWTEWTQGFQFGCAILGYEMTGEDDLLGIGVEGTVERMASHVTHIGVHDHGGIVWDEFVGIWLTLWLIPDGWIWLVLAFILFRLFDIAKPWPIGWLDRKLGGGLGIMMDDVLAGVFAWGCLQVLALFI